MSRALALACGFAACGLAFTFTGDLRHGVLTLALSAGSLALAPFLA